MTGASSNQAPAAFLSWSLLPIWIEAASARPERPQLPKRIPLAFESSEIGMDPCRLPAEDKTRKSAGFVTMDPHLRNEVIQHSSSCDCIVQGTQSILQRSEAL